MQCIYSAMLVACLILYSSAAISGVTAVAAARSRPGGTNANAPFTASRGVHVQQLQHGSPPFLPRLPFATRRRQHEHDTPGSTALAVVKLVALIRGGAMNPRIPGRAGGSGRPEARAEEVSEDDSEGKLVLHRALRVRYNMLFVYRAYSSTSHQGRRGATQVQDRSTGRDTADRHIPLARDV